MLFWLKKFIAFWLMPLPLCLALLLAGWHLSRSGRRARLGRALVGAAALLLLLLSNKVVSTALVRPIETQYPPVSELRPDQPVPAALGACRYVVVLGSGHGDTPGLPASLRLSSSAVARITEAVRLLRVLPDARLLVSGPAIGRNSSHAAVLAQAAEALGVDPGRIQRIETARDTEDEANAVERIVGPAPVALVTSAWHMPRSAGLFRRAGVRILPCPADFSARPNADFRWEDLGWDVESLERSTRAVHERLGYLWGWMRGKVK